jgi:3-oxoacyl-[acyl-carrier-protein] synthase II
MRTVVVSGIGVVSPVGVGVEAFWHAVSGGGTGLTFEPHPAGAPDGRVIARVRDFDAARYVKDAKLRRVCNRSFEMLASAAVLAWADGGGERLAAQAARVGVSVGIGPIDQYTDDLQRAIAASAIVDGRVDLRAFVAGARHLHPLRRLQYLPNIGAAIVSMLHRATGPTLTFVSGPAAGLQAIDAAATMIRNGAADAVICGGVDARIAGRLWPTAAAQFALSDEADPDAACRPFDRSRSGIVVGEGAAVLLLEAGDLSPRGPDDVYATLVDARTYGRDNGAAVVRRMLDDGGTGTPDVVIAHGEGSSASDDAEAQTLMALFGDVPVAPSITSIQPAIGHTLCASAPFAAAAACLSVAGGSVPPLRSIADPIVRLPFVTGASSTRATRSALVNFVGPGGAGGSLLFAAHAS